MSTNEPDEAEDSHKEGELRRPGRKILGITAALVVFVVAMMVVAAVMQHVFNREETKGRGHKPDAGIAQGGFGDRFEASFEKGIDLAELNAKKQDMLRKYEWVDHDRGITRIPIEDAMAMIVNSQGALP